MKTFTVGANDAGQRLDKFITKAVPRLPQSLLYKALRKKDIKLNGKRAEISARLTEGDTVTLYVPDEFFAPVAEKYSFLGAGKQLDIIYEDKNILVLDKKVGLLSHPDEGEYTDTLITRVQRYLYEKKEYDPKAENAFAPALANRIDRNTGGIVLAAKNAEALRILNDKIREREIKKLYLCLLIGCPAKKEDTLTGFITKDEKKNLVTVYRDAVPGGRQIRTKYRVLDTKNGLSLAEVDLLTGRTHQIRAHFASIGCPLLGDGKYGTNEQNKRFGGYKKQCLYSYKTEFRFTGDAGLLEYLNGKSFTAPGVWFRDAFYNGTL